MRVHIVKRNDTFESIAQHYGISLQDLIGMNTHINYLAGLVPGLKIKLPDTNRKGGLSFQEKVQTHFPKVDTQAVDIPQAGEAAEAAAEILDAGAIDPAGSIFAPQPLEDAMTIPLQGLETPAIADGVQSGVPAEPPAPMPTFEGPSTNVVNEGVSNLMGGMQPGNFAPETYGIPRPMESYEAAMYSQAYQTMPNFTSYGWEMPQFPSPYFERSTIHIPPGSYTTYIPGPATVIFHNNWEPRNDFHYPSEHSPVVYPGGYGYQYRGAAPCMGRPAVMPAPNPIAHRYPDEASYWAAFPWK